MKLFRPFLYLLPFLFAAFGPLLIHAEEGYSTAVVAKTILKTTTDVAGQPIQYPHSGTAEITGLLVEVPVGQSTGWHVHPNPCVAYILEGRIAVELADGTTHTYGAGDSFAEVRNLRHRGRNIGDVPVKIVFFALGETGAPVSVAAPN